MEKPPKDFTKQEKIIASFLKSCGLRYESQYQMGKYIVDFFIQELDNLVIEADGVYGHLKKADKIRDTELLALGAGQIIHVKAVTKETIESYLKDKLCQDFQG